MMKKAFNIVIILLVLSCKKKQDKIENQEVKSLDSARMESVNQHQTTTKPSQIPVIKPKQKTVECKDKGGSMENGFITECLYINYNLEEAYNEFRKHNKANDDGKFLEEKMPAGKHIAGFNDYPISVTYSYPKQNILEVEILFPGGVTIISFKEEKDEVIVQTNHSPD